MAFKECPAVETRLAFETYTWGMSFPCQPTLVMEHELLFPVRNTYEAFSRTHFPSLHLRGDAVRRRAKQTAVRNGGSVDESGSVSGAVVAALALFVAAPRCLQVRRPARRSAPRRRRWRRRRRRRLGRRLRWTPPDGSPGERIRKLIRTRSPNCGSVYRKNKQKITKNSVIGFKIPGGRFGGAAPASSARPQNRTPSATCAFHRLRVMNGVTVSTCHTVSQLGFD